MNILIVEDDKNVRGFLRLLLSEQGHAVEDAANGQEGLARVRERRPDLIISDGLMPVMDGFQLLQALKSDPGLSTIPFIFLSAVFTGQRELDLAHSLGADAFLVKPQKPEAILDAVRSAADRRAAHRVRPAAAGEDPEFAREYSRIVATTLEEKVRQLETATAELERAQEDLRESETIYRGLFEHSPQPMWVYNHETLAFLAVNDAAIIAYGFSREEFLSMTIKDIRPPEDVPVLLDHLAGTREGFGDAGTWKHRKKDGAIIDVEITSHTLPFLGRQAKLVLANDVTERTKLEKTIRAASEEWRSTLDAMSDAIALLDRDGSILRCNKAMATLVDKPFSDIIGKRCGEVLYSTAAPEDGCPHETMKKSRKRETLVAQMGDRWFDVAADPFFDSEGNLLGAVHIMADITERKQADEVLRKRESQLAESQRIAGIGSWERDLATNAVVWSHELFRIVGLDPERVAPSYEVLMGLITPEDREIQKKDVQKAIRENKPYSTDFRIVKPDGTTALIHSQGEVVCDEAGRPVLLRGTAQDITERRQMEDALKAAVVRAEDEKARSDSIISAIGDGISIQDRDFRVLYQNQAMKELVGNHVGEPCYLAYEKKEEQCDGCGVAQVFRDGGTHVVERSAPTDKGLVHVEITASPLRDAKGNIIAGIEVVHNITERKKAEDLLREQQRFTENMIMGSAIATFVLDAEHNVLIWNKACEELTGVPASEMVGTDGQWKPFYDHERPVLADIVLGKQPERLALLYSDASTSELLPEGLHAEDWFRSLNGRDDRYVVSDAAPIRDSSGKIIAAVETLQDITERKTLENQIYRSKQDWEDTFNSITDMVTVHDKDYNIILANKAAERILHLPLLEKMKDRKCFAYYHGTDHAPEGCPSCGCIQTGVSALFEIFEPHLNMFIEIRAIPRFDSNNNLIGLIHVVRDISERKRAQDQLNERVNQAALGAEIGVALTAGGDQRSVLQQCAEAMVRHLDAAFARIWTLNEKDNVLEMQASAGMYTHINGAHGRVPVGKFKIGMIAEERIPHLTNQVVGDPRVGDQEWAIKEEMVAFAGYPLIVQDRLVGVMAMFSRAPLAESTLNSLGSVADIIALGIERKRAEESLSRYSKELAELNTASNTLMVIASLDDIYAHICDVIYGVFDLKMVWLGIVEPDTYEVKPVAHTGRDDGYLSSIKITWDGSRYGKGPTGMAIKTMKSVMANIEDPAFAPWSEQARQRGYVASLAVPLIYSRDKCIGALNFYSDDPGYFTPDRVKLCEIFANQAAIAIENARLVEGLEEKVFERTKALEDTNIEIQTVNKELVFRREDAEAASRSKTDFLANMSHELRTPLNAIMGFSEIMLMDMAGPVTAKQREFLNDISKSGKHLLSLINDVLDLSKVEAGKMELEPETLIVEDLIAGSLMMFKEKSLKHAIKVETLIDPAVADITADRRKLKQTLMNLLSNAMKFTPDGGSVRVSARRIEGEKVGRWEDEKKNITSQPLNFSTSTDLIEISVSDTGIGIPREQQKKLFQPFEQIDSTLSRKHAGSGLGLSLCRRFVELHGGRIWVESEPGKGSTFSFAIPVRQP